MNNYNYPFPQNGNNNQNTWQNNGQNWNNLQDSGMYGFQRQPMNYQQMRSMMNQQMQPMQQGSKIDRVNGTPVTLAYELNTSITYQLTPQQLTTLRGINNIWSSANGEVEIKYWKH